MKIAFFGTDADKQQYFTSKLTGHDLYFSSDELTENYLLQRTDFEIISVFVESKVTKQVIDSLPSLKLIVARSTGFDNVDIKYAKEKGIVVSNIPAYGSHTVAEFTFALILALTRHIAEAVVRTKEKNEFSYESLRGYDLNGKTLGVLGTGKIGQNVIQIAKGFNMNVVAYDTFPNQELASKYAFRYVSLTELLQSSDIVTVHVPYMPETQHLINKENIFKMKKGALLINTARGGIVETEALFKALIEKHLAGAGLDVLEEENDLKEEIEFLAHPEVSASDFRTLLQNHMLIDMENVIVTPHMAFYTKEAEQNILDTTIENITSFEQGSPKNAVNN